MMKNMGMQFGLESKSGICKRQHRWMFSIKGVSGETVSGISALPPEKSSRPSMVFKEMNVNHLTEEVFFPGRAEWKPINVTLFDLKMTTHPVFNWILSIYDPKKGTFEPPTKNSFIKDASLTLFDGVGNIVESWMFEDCWPQSVNFQNLDMNSTGVVMCDLTLRYARAYLYENFITDLPRSPSMPSTNPGSSPNLPPPMVA